MKDFCSKPNNFFTTDCKTWLTNLRTNAIKDGVARSVCPSIKDTGTVDQKRFCSCYNATVPPDLQNDPVLRSYVYCLTPDCQQFGLKPAQEVDKPCPLNYVICENKDILQRLSDRGAIDRNEITNRCSINIGNPNAPPGTPPSTPGAPAQPSQPGQPSQPSQPPAQPRQINWAIIGVGLAVVLIIIILTMIFILR
jgi:hypothetical protein